MDAAHGITIEHAPGELAGWFTPAHFDSPRAEPVLSRWEAAAREASLAALRAIACVPFAVARADRVPGGRRLRPADRWMETPDAPVLPADALYEDRVAAVQRLAGDAVASAYWLLRNRAYGVLAAHAFVPLPGDVFVVGGDAHPGDAFRPQPTVPGTWRCAVFRGDEDELVAFECDTIGLWPAWAGGRFWQRKFGWKLRAILGRLAEGLPPTAAHSSAGYLQPPTMRPAQRAIRP